MNTTDRSASLDQAPSRSAVRNQAGPGDLSLGVVMNKRTRDRIREPIGRVRVDMDGNPDVELNNVPGMEWERGTPVYHGAWVERLTARAAGFREAQSELLGLAVQAVAAHDQVGYVEPCVIEGLREAIERAEGK